MAAQPNPDPIAQLAVTLTALDRQVRGTGEAARRSEANRLLLLYVHAISAILVGPSFIAYATSPTDPTAGPTWVVARQVPAFPWSFGLVVLLGGLILLPATILRAPRLAGIGVALIAVFYGTVAVSFIGAVVLWLNPDAYPHSPPAAYAAVVYAHLATVMAVHFRTVAKQVQAARRDRR